MSLVRKKLTPRLIAGNRANSRKSTGPRTDLGKTHSSRNAGKHLAYAQVLPPNMKELGEDPAEYERLHRSLQETFQPRDSFEEMLVEDMAQLRWRLKRLKRAEVGILLCQRRELEIDRESRLCREGREGTLPPDALFGPFDHVYLSGLPDGTYKFRALLEALQTLKEDIRAEGLHEGHIDHLRQIYGEKASFTGEELIDLCQSCVESEEKPGEAESRANIDWFLAKLQEEIKSVERLAQLYKESKVEVSHSMLEAQLLPRGENLDKILRYETALERQFKEKLQLLVAWRREGGEPTPAVNSERKGANPQSSDSA